MSARWHNVGVQFVLGLALAGGLLFAVDVRADEFTNLVADRTAIERVYYSHRTGQHQTFDQTITPADRERLVRADIDKERVLKSVYNIAVTDAMVASEVNRINATTRAPDVLAELKAVLGNDPTRFGRTVARPLVVERELRVHFNNDDSLHLGLRTEAEQVRGELLAAKTNGTPSPKLVELLKRNHAGEVSDTSWLLTPRPAEPKEEAPDLMEVKKKYGPDAQIVSSPRDVSHPDKLYFSDLPVELQQVLAVQLKATGDVSAVIEAPEGFLLYLARDRTATQLDVACLALAKRDYIGWLHGEIDKLEK